MVGELINRRDASVIDEIPGAVLAVEKLDENICNSVSADSYSVREVLLIQILTPVLLPADLRRICE